MPALADGAFSMRGLERRRGIGRRQTDTDLLGTSAVMTALLDRLCQGVVLVEGGGRVRYANRMAHRLSAAGDALRIRGGRLSVVAVPDALLLAKAIKAASAGGPEQALRLRRPCGKRPLLALIMPGGSLPGARGAGCALLLVTDPANVTLPPKERLIQAYGFTTTEGALARLLLQGSDLAAAARELNVAMATVRSHLRGLLAKTATHRQADLVRVLLQEMGPIE